MFILFMLIYAYLCWLSASKVGSFSSSVHPVYREAESENTSITDTLNAQFKLSDVC